MARRSPVAQGLPKQLALLQQYGYRVITVSELLSLCPFADLSPESPVFAPAKALLEAGFCICYRDNTVRPEQILTRGELCMFAFGWKTAARRIELVQTKTRVCRDVPCRHPYAAAIELALERGCMQQRDGRFFPDEPVSPEDFSGFCRALFGQSTQSPAAPITHAQAIELLAAFAGREPL